MPSKEKKIKKMIAIKDCKESNEKKFLNHILKNQDVEMLVKERNAKGDSKIKTFIKIYLKE